MQHYPGFPRSKPVCYLSLRKHIYAAPGGNVQKWQVRDGFCCRAVPLSTVVILYYEVAKNYAVDVVQMGNGENQMEGAQKHY